MSKHYYIRGDTLRVFGDTNTDGACCVLLEVQRGGKRKEKGTNTKISKIVKERQVLSSLVTSDKCF